MSTLAPLEIEPGIYSPEDDEYITLNALDPEDWTRFLDHLATDGRTASFDSVENTFIVT